MLFLAAHVLSAVADVYGLIVRSPAILLALLIVAGLFHVNSILRGSFDAPRDCRGDAGMPDTLEATQSFLRRLEHALLKAFRSVHA